MNYIKLAAITIFCFLASFTSIGQEFNGGIMAGVGLILYYRKERYSLDQINAKKFFVTAGITIIIWSFFCGFIRQSGFIFPSDIINQDLEVGKTCMTNIQPIRSKLCLEVLQPDQLADIRAATLQILETVGIHFPSERALQMFEDNGAQVDKQRQIVRIPQKLVLDAMNCAPRTYTLSGFSGST